jgi:hypothetical protein
MPWNEPVEWSEQDDLLAIQLYVITSEPRLTPLGGICSGGRGPDLM